MHTGLPSDIVLEVEVGEVYFHLHKFPLLSRSGVMERRIPFFFLIKKRKEEIQKHPKKGIGTQLDQAALEDLLMPSFFHTIENIYDVDSVQKILDHFLSTD